MRDTDLYARILGVERSRQVTEEVKVEYTASGAGSCLKCGAAAARYDSRPRRWRYMPTWQYETILAAEVSRVRCPQHGVKTLAVPWSEPGSGCTALFEALGIDY